MQAFCGFILLANVFFLSNLILIFCDYIEPANDLRNADCFYSPHAKDDLRGSEVSPVDQGSLGKGSHEVWRVSEGWGGTSQGEFSSAGLRRVRKESETEGKGGYREYPFLLLLASFLTEGRQDLAGVLFFDTAVNLFRCASPHARAARGVRAPRTGHVT